MIISLRGKKGYKVISSFSNGGLPAARGDTRIGDVDFARGLEYIRAVAASIGCAIESIIVSQNILLIFLR